MKKIFIACLCALSIIQLQGKFCDISKTYDKAIITDSISQAVSQCLHYYPDDVESCVWCTFDGHIDEQQLTKEINRAKQQKEKKTSSIAPDAAKKITILKKGQQHK